MGIFNRVVTQIFDWEEIKSNLPSDRKTVTEEFDVVEELPDPVYRHPPQNLIDVEQIVWCAYDRLRQQRKEISSEAIRKCCWMSYGRSLEIKSIEITLEMLGEKDLL